MAAGAAASARLARRREEWAYARRGGLGLLRLGLADLLVALLLTLGHALTLHGALPPPTYAPHAAQRKGSAELGS